MLLSFNIMIRVGLFVLVVADLFFLKIYEQIKNIITIYYFKEILF